MNARNLDISRHEEILKDQGKEMSHEHLEDLNYTSSNKYVEETNLCQMVDIISEESDSDQKGKVNFNDPESLIKAYHELLSNLSILAKRFQKSVQRS